MVPSPSLINVLRCVGVRRVVTSHNFGFRQLSTSSDDNNNKEDETKPKRPKRKDRTPTPTRTTKDATEAKSKLNDLLQSIVKEGQQKKELDKKIDFNLARKETPKPTPEEIMKKEQDKATIKQIGKEMLSAVKKVAESVDGDAQSMVENELVQRLKSQSQGKIDMGKLFEGMKVDPSKAEPRSQSHQPPQTDDMSRARRVRQELGGGPRPPRQRREDLPIPGYRPIDLFGAKPLGIFTQGKAKSGESPPVSYLKTWDTLHQKELKLASTHPPAHGFEEMIMWTEQGKLWQFPINNEQGLEEEAKVSFIDHIFLEPHVDSWCPKKGPIRHFMELVCIGLSKNPYLTVEEKKDQIEWFHQYFKDKANIIKEVGAGEIK